MMNIGKHVKNGHEAANSIINKSVKHTKISKLMAIKFVTSFFINCTPMTKFSYDKNIKFKVSDLLIEFSRLEKIILNLTGFISALTSGRSERYLHLEFYFKRIKSVIFKRSWF